MVGDYGAVFVYVRKGRDFPRMIADAEDSCNPYFSAKIGDQTETAQPVKNTCVRSRPPHKSASSRPVETP